MITVEGDVAGAGRQPGEGPPVKTGFDAAIECAPAKVRKRTDPDREAGEADDAKVFFMREG